MRRRQSPSYDDLILGTPGLVSYWRLGEPPPIGAVTARDECARNHGTYVNNPTNGPSAINDGNASKVFVAASIQFVTVPDSASHNLTTSLSCEAWVKYTNIAESPIISRWKVATFYLLAVATNFIGMYVNVGGTKAASSPVANNDGLWHHAVGTWDGAAVKVYVDGILRTSTAAAGTITGGANEIVIGAYSSTHEAPFAGSIDEPALYSRALTPGEISEHYYAGRGR